MSHLERVPDGVDEPRSNSNYVMIFAIVVVAFVVLGLALLWGGGYMGGRGFNMMGFSPSQMMAPATQVPAQAPAAQGTPGAAGAAGAAGASGAGGTGGSGGAAGAAGSAGAPGATGAQGATAPTATP